MKERVRFCRECGNLTEEEVCSICLDARRDHTTVCVVEQPVDLISVERTHEYRGLYHVLGGALSPLDGVEPGDLRIDELLRRVDANGVQEVVLATNPNMTGEATAAFLADRLRGRVRVTRLASGLPGRRRPRVRRRGDARPRPVRPPRDGVGARSAQRAIRCGELWRACRAHETRCAARKRCASRGARPGVGRSHSVGPARSLLAARSDAL